MASRILILIFVFLSANSCLNKDIKENCITGFYEKIGNVKFPLNSEVISHSEDADISTYLIKLKLNLEDINDFIDDSPAFEKYNGEIVGNGINFSEDDIVLADIESYFGMELNTIPRDMSRTYLLRMNNDSVNLVYVLDTDSKILWGLTEYRGNLIFCG